jgi:hypothetical protein
MNKKNKIRTLSQRDRLRIVTVIGMAISGLALLAIFASVLGIFALEARQEQLIAENPGSLMYRYALYLLYAQIALAAVTVFASFFFMFHKLWGKNLLIKSIWAFFLFYIFIGIVMVFDMNRSIDFGNMSSIMSFVLPLCVVAFMMRYIYIYLNKLIEKINSEKIAGLFK